MKNQIKAFLILAAIVLSGAQSFACAAIAFNTKTFAWGRATGYSDLGDAMSNAMNDCGGGCGVYAWTCNSSVTAIVFGNGNWATSTGVDADSAVQNARAACNGNCGTGYVTAGSD
jgi:hypothetical protein